ncbi:MAG TPA: outer membrane beta-barrel protein [Gammaproteobacteria bacterium]|nr:outer membrane beta-barrel protein [Gammaproteobacteria bacterium]
MKHYVRGFRTAALALTLGLGSMWAANAQAANNTGIGKLYFGVKGGLMMNDVGGFGDAINIGGIVGAPVSHMPQGTISVEGELTTTLSKGDVNYFGYTGNWDITTLAGYGVFRTNGPMYLKAKAGYLFEDVSVSIGGLRGYGSDSGLSFGVGGGMRLAGGHRIEIEYTVIESDVNFLSIGYNF